MNDTKRTTKIGILASIVLILFLITIFVSKNLNTFRNEKVIFLVTDHTHDLEEKNPVTINGVDVGEIQEISLLTNSLKVLLTIELKENYPIPKSSKFNVIPNGFAGEYLSIETQVMTTNTEDIIRTGDTIFAAINFEQQQLFPDSLRNGVNILNEIGNFLIHISEPDSTEQKE